VRKILFCACLLSFTLQIIYFGAQFALGSLGVNVYINTLVAAFGMTIVLIPAFYLIPKMRRKFWLYLIQLVSCIVCLCFWFITASLMQTILAGIVKALNRLVLSLFSIWVNEVLAT